MNLPTGRLHMHGFTLSRERWEAVTLGMMSRYRRPLGRAGSVMSRGRFEDIEPDSCRADNENPTGLLRVRIGTPSGDRRSAQVAPRIVPGDGVVPFVEGRKRAAGVLMVTAVECRRLHDISEQAAQREGLAIFAAGVIENIKATDAETVADTARVTYFQLLAKLGRIRAGAWQKTEQHQVANMKGPTWRDCFALYWMDRHGLKSWKANPWVWDFFFAYMPVTPEQYRKAGKVAWGEIWGGVKS